MTILVHVDNVWIVGRANYRKVRLVIDDYGLSADRSVGYIEATACVAAIRLEAKVQGTARADKNSRVEVAHVIAHFGHQFALHLAGRIVDGQIAVAAVASVRNLQGVEGQLQVKVTGRLDGVRTI